MSALGAFRGEPFSMRLTKFFSIDKIKEYQQSLTFSQCALLLVCSLLLGGGTRDGRLSDTIVEFVAIPALLVSLSSLTDWTIWSTRTRPDIYKIMAFCFAIVVLPLIQLIPLPPWIWSKLPGREHLTAVYEV